MSPPAAHLGSPCALHWHTSSLHCLQHACSPEHDDYRSRAAKRRAVVSALSFGTMTLNDNPGGEVEGKITRGEEAYDLLAAAYKGGVNVSPAVELSLALVHTRPHTNPLRPCRTSSSTAQKDTAALEPRSACWASVCRRVWSAVCGSEWTS